MAAFDRGDGRGVLHLLIYLWHLSVPISALSERDIPYIIAACFNNRRVPSKRVLQAHPSLSSVMWFHNYDGSVGALVFIEYFVFVLNNYHLLI